MQIPSARALDTRRVPKKFCRHEPLSVFPACVGHGTQVVQKFDVAEYCKITTFVLSEFEARSNEGAPGRDGILILPESTRISCSQLFMSVPQTPVSGRRVHV